MEAATPNHRPLTVVNGCPRSGTSVLSTLLAGRLDAALTPETHFIPLFTPYLRLWGGLKTPRQRERLIRAIYGFTEIRTVRTKGRGLDIERMRPYLLLATAESAPMIARDCDSYPAIVEALLDDYRARHEGALVVEKTAYYSPVPWQQIAEVLPSAKFLHVIRDGRDVALSWRKTWFGPKTIALCAELWAAHIRAGLEWERIHPERSFRVRYEELVAFTENVLADIAAYLGVPLLANPVEQSSVEWLGELADHEHMKNLGKPINTTSANRWRNGMDPQDVATFEAIAGDELEAVGYERSLPRRAARRNGAPARARAQLKSLTSSVEWKRRMMRKLPPALWLADTLGFSLPRVLSRLGLTG
jgi:hypothetical protein